MNPNPSKQNALKQNSFGAEFDEAKLWSITR